MEFNSFVTWDMLKTYTVFVSINFAIVQVIKNIGFLKNLPTKFVSICIAFVLQVLVNMQFKTFRIMDLVLYLISAIIISLTSNGLADGTINFKTKNINTNGV